MNEISLQDIHALLRTLVAEQAAFRTEMREEHARHREQDRAEQQRLRELDRQYIEGRMDSLQLQLESLQFNTASSQTLTSTTSCPTFNSELEAFEGCAEAAEHWDRQSDQPTWVAQEQRVTTPVPTPSCETFPAVAGLSSSLGEMASQMNSEAPHAPLAFTVLPSDGSNSQADAEARRLTWCMPTQNPKQCPLCLKIFQHKRCSYCTPPPQQLQTNTCAVTAQHIYRVP
jgi:hypothetical protein